MNIPSDNFESNYDNEVDHEHQAIFEAIRLLGRLMDDAKREASRIEEGVDPDEAFLESIEFDEDGELEDNPYEALFTADYCSPVDTSYVQARGYVGINVDLATFVGNDFVDRKIVPSSENIDPGFYSGSWGGVKEDLSRNASSIHTLFVPSPEVAGEDAKPFLLNSQIVMRQQQEYKYSGYEKRKTWNHEEVWSSIVRMSEYHRIVEYVDWKDVQTLAGMGEQKARFIIGRALDSLSGE